MNNSEHEASDAAISRISLCQSSCANYSRPVRCLFFILYKSIMSIIPIISVLFIYFWNAGTITDGQKTIFVGFFLWLIFADTQAETWCFFNLDWNEMGTQSLHNIKGSLCKNWSPVDGPSKQIGCSIWPESPLTAAHYTLLPSLAATSHHQLVSSVGVRASGPISCLPWLRANQSCDCCSSGKTGWFIWFLVCFC